MATQKITLNKLGLKRNDGFFPLEWNGQTILIKQYLPIEEKLNLVDRVVNNSVDNNNFANPARIDILTMLEIMYTYTNINFTEKQKEDIFGTYDLLMSSGLLEAVFKTLGETDEIRFINRTIREVIDEFYKYKDSILGILDAINKDYSNLNFDAENIQKNLADPNNLALLKDVVTKLG